MKLDRVSFPDPTHVRREECDTADYAVYFDSMKFDARFP